MLAVTDAAKPKTSKQGNSLVALKGNYVSSILFRGLTCSGVGLLSRSILSTQACSDNTQCDCFVTGMSSLAQLHNLQFLSPKPWRCRHTRQLLGGSRLSTRWSTGLRVCKNANTAFKSSSVILPKKYHGIDERSCRAPTLP